MSDPVKANTFPFYGWLWPVLLILAISGVSGVSNPSLPISFTFHDKAAHFLVFGLLATTLVRLPLFCKGHWWMMLACIAIPSAFGGLDEWHQSWVPGRMVDVADWVADTLGAAVAVFAYLFIAPYRKLLEWGLLPIRNHHKAEN